MEYQWMASQCSAVGARATYSNYNASIQAQWRRTSIFNEDLLERYTNLSNTFDVFLGALDDFIMLYTPKARRCSHILWILARIRVSLRYAYRLPAIVPFRYRLDYDDLMCRYDQINYIVHNEAVKMEKSISHVWLNWWRVIDSYDAYNSAIEILLADCTRREQHTSYFMSSINRIITLDWHHRSCADDIRALELPVPPNNQELADYHDHLRWLLDLIIYVSNQMRGYGLLVPLTRREMQDQLRLLDQVLELHQTPVLECSVVGSRDGEEECCAESWRGEEEEVSFQPLRDHALGGSGWIGG